jgi:hypothetical protein
MRASKCRSRLREQPVFFNASPHRSRASMQLSDDERDELRTTQNVLTVNARQISFAAA